MVGPVNNSWLKRGGGIGPQGNWIHTYTHIHIYIYIYINMYNIYIYIYIQTHLVVALITNIFTQQCTVLRGEEVKILRDTVKYRCSVYKTYS